MRLRAKNERSPPFGAVGPSEFALASSAKASSMLFALALAAS